MPLYLSMLFKIMKAEGTHEGCIEQVELLFRESLYGDNPKLDEDGRLRADYKELAPHVQQQVSDLWQQVQSDNIDALTDFKGYQTEFLQLFGFEMPGVDYDAEVNPEVPIANMV